MNIIKNKNFRAGRNCGTRTEKIQYIVIHYTGSEGTAANNVSYFNGGNRGASAHYFVDRTGAVYEYCDPKQYYAWHCGGALESGHHPYHGKCTNRNSIGVEICTHNNGKTWEFTEKAVSAAVELTKDLMKQFGVPASNVIRHYDVTGKACPRVPGWGAVGGSDAWNKFKAQLTAQETVSEYYRVRKTWEDVESQKGAYSIIANARAEADKWNGTYGVFDWNGKEVYRPEKKDVKDPEIFNYWPCWARKTSPDDRRGSGTVFIDENGNCVVYDAFVENSVPCKKLIAYMKKHDVTHYTAIGSHAHMDHIGGFFSMMKEKGLIMDMLVCYDPDSLKLAGSGNENARSVRDDKAYMQKLISKAKAAGVKIRYVVTGDKLSVGQMNFKFYRKQPTAFGDQDNGKAYGYMNHGSLAIYNYELGTLYSADGPKSGADMLEYFADEEVEVVDSEHHGNGAGKTYAQSMKKRGVVLCIEANNEKGGPGSCNFTQYGSRRIIEAGIPVWMLNSSVYGHAKNGKVTWKQTGKKTITYDTEFGRKEAAQAAKTDQERFIEKIGAMAKADMAKSGICAAVTIAQAILESGWGKSELAKNANNLFGMKKSLSGNTWPNSAWDGKSVYSKQTKEVYASGPATVQADFRAYKTLQDSVNDHSAYLAGARNGSSLRYKGLVGCADYKKSAQIIKAGDYATAPDYVEKLCRLVEQYDLTKYNTTYKATESDAKTPYTVKVSTQIPILKAPAGTKVKTCPKGIYTIVEEKSGYGRLKSGAGWIQLSKVTKM